MTPSFIHKNFHPLNIPLYLSKWKINDECSWIRQHKLSICKIGKKQSKNRELLNKKKQFLNDEYLIKGSSILQRLMTLICWSGFTVDSKHIFLRLTDKKVAKIIFFVYPKQRIKLFHSAEMQERAANRNLWMIFLLCILSIKLNYDLPKNWVLFGFFHYYRRIVMPFHVASK